MLERALAVEGFTKPSELEWLHRTAAALPDGAQVAEIGSWKGRSTLAICEGLRDKPGVRLTAIDTFAGDAEVHQTAAPQSPGSVRAEFDANTAGFDFLDVIQAESIVAAEQVADATFDWIFIDAAHDYRSVVADVAAWAPKVKPGGLISGHDYGRSGVTDAVTRVFANVAQEHSIWSTRDRPRLRPLHAARAWLRHVRD